MPCPTRRASDRGAASPRSVPRVDLAMRRSIGHAPAHGSHQRWTWTSLGKTGARDICSPGRRRGAWQAPRVPPFKDCAQAADMPRGDRDPMSRPVRARRVEEAAMMDVRRRWGVRAATAVMAFALMLRASAGHAAIAVESTSSASAKAASSLTWSHTVGPSLNRILMVGVSSNNTTRTVSSVTYGGTALTRVGFQNAPGTQNRIELWSLIAPSPGTANVVVTFSGSVDSVGGAIVFSGVDQAAPLGTFASANGSNASPSVTVSR